MSKQRRTFSAEIKPEAGALVLDQDISAPAVRWERWIRPCAVG